MKIELIYRGVIRSKKNSKQIVRDKSGVPRIISNANARAMEQEMIQQFRGQLIDKGFGDLVWNSQTANILDAKESGRTYSVEAIIYNPDRIRRDLDNQITSLLDGLVRAGALPDDCSSIVTKISAEFGGVDREDPRAEITVESNA